MKDVEFQLISYICSLNPNSTILDAVKSNFIKTTDMRLRHIIAGILTILATFANAQTSEKPQRIFIIEGLFFNELPADRAKTHSMLSLRTANGTKATGLILTQPLSEEARKMAMPQATIPEADILLEMYDERVEQMKRSFSSQTETLEPGERFPDFKATDIDGRIWTNADVAGKVMVLNCWFTGCGPCLAEMPELSEWKDRMPDVMFFSSTYEKASTAAPVLERREFNWIPIIGDKQFKYYVGVKGYPMTVVVDKTGIIREVEFGTSPEKRERLRQTIESLR